jgi:hypothetical protein
VWRIQQFGERRRRRLVGEHRQRLIVERQHVER